MTYIILRDTFGDGLETISNIGVDVIEKHQLNEYICAAAEIVANEEAKEFIENYKVKYTTKGFITRCSIQALCEVL